LTNKRIVYIIGPYSAPTEEAVEVNIEIARVAAERFWQNGIVTVCPHLNTAHMDGIASYETFVEGLCLLLKRCDLGFVLPEWHTSAGSLREMEVATQAFIPLTTHFDLAMAYVKGPEWPGAIQRVPGSTKCPRTGVRREYILHTPKN